MISSTDIIPLLEPVFFIGISMIRYCFIINVPIFIVLVKEKFAFGHSASKVT